MAKVRVSVGGQAARIANDISRGGRVVRRVIEVARRATSETRQDLDDAWPRQRNQRGRVMHGEPYKERARAKGHNILKHSGDLFVTKSGTQGGRISERVANPANWAFKIRSRQVGKSNADNVERFRKRKGDTKQRYVAQIQAGAAPHAWSTLGSKPWKKKMPRIAREVREVIAKG